ncbi:copper transport protein [Kribbella aluminosa]|uniref:Copper transport protein n=1 Tax=Kribbella aluminosa TaxID=416017 RepID=A0ABS4UBI9_9ACTN|nr:copper resistance protein CopC [Kribbella aluminosa]MBP2348971.1 copper transport protein [Kribbella aluminosa]
MTPRALLPRLSLVAAAVFGLLFGTAAPAAAHPTLLSTTPQAGYSVAAAPDLITLVFDEPVTVDSRAVRLVDDAQHSIRTSDVTREQGGRRVTIRVLDDLGPGRYIVRWQVTAQDGDVVDSGFDFAVGTSSAGLQGQDQTGTGALPVTVALRWLLFLALAGVIGGLVGGQLARLAGPAAVRPRSFVRPAALLGLLGAAGLLAHLLVTAGPGRAAALLVVEAIGFAAVAAIAGRGRWWLALTPALAIVGAEGLRNHLGSRHGVVGALIVAVHLMAVATWIGALVHLVRVAYTNRARAVRIRPMFAAYSRLALGLFLTVATTGTISAVLLVPTLKDLTTTWYGQLLIAKLALVTIVAALAWTARRRLTRPTAQPASAPTTPAPVARTARIEATTLVTVLAVTAVLVSVPTPAPATQDLGFPPPVAGPAIRLGALAGQISVGIAASQNQLEIRLRTPDDRVQTGDAAPPDFHLTARLSYPGTAPATVALRPCGPGCFVGPAQWGNATQYVDLRVDTPDWHGGAATVPISWPPRPSRVLLPRIVAAMRTQRSIRIAETVTSDTSLPAPRTRPVTTDGAEFLESEPYGNSPALDTTVLPATNGRTTLAFGLPAEGIHVQLEIDTSNRITRETLTAPKHLIQRTFTYPRN